MPCFKMVYQVATFTRKIVIKNFLKSPNLVTLDWQLSLQEHTSSVEYRKAWYTHSNYPIELVLGNVYTLMQMPLSSVYFDYIWSNQLYFKRIKTWISIENCHKHLAKIILQLYINSQRQLRFSSLLRISILFWEFFECHGPVMDLDLRLNV